MMGPPQSYRGPGNRLLADGINHPDHYPEVGLRRYSPGSNSTHDNPDIVTLTCHHILTLTYHRSGTGPTWIDLLYLRPLHLTCLCRSLGRDQPACQQELPPHHPPAPLRGRMGYQLPIQLPFHKSSADRPARAGYPGKDLLVGHHRKINHCLLTGAAKTPLSIWLHITPLFMTGCGNK